MSREQLKNEQVNTFDALHRMITAERTESQAFRKLVERLAWIGAELERNGWTD